MNDKEIEKFKALLKSYKKTKTKLDQTNNEIHKLNEKRKKAEKSTLYEEELQKLPPQAIGSVILYNKLNENYSLYDEAQFNKIIRFVQHIENREKRYRDLYVKCTNGYIANPEGIPLKDLKREKHDLGIIYQLLAVLVHEVDGDIVSYNKVYNKLEDSGMFMTIPEKQNQEALNQISMKLDDVISGLKAVFSSLEETNRNLQDISYNTMESASNTGEMSDSLWGISYEMSKK